MFDAVRDDDFTLYRIDATRSIAKINAQIDVIVEKIQEKINTVGPLHWDTEEDIVHKIIAKQSIRVEDNDKFNRIIDAMRILGKNYKGMQCSYFRLEDGLLMWFPALSVRNEAGELTSGNNSGWINSFNHDWTMITEGREDEMVLDKQQDHQRIVFMKIKDDIMRRNQYQFVGVFRFDSEASTSKLRVYKKTDNTLSLARWNR